MKGGTTLSREEIFRDALLLGVSFGLLHAVVESSLLGWYGVPFSALDLAIFAAVWVALFLAVERRWGSPRAFVDSEESLEIRAASQPRGN
ncbi:MAG: hypothetical protein ACRD21_29765 [Vicinamibacteria bacterium]